MKAPSITLATLGALAVALLNACVGSSPTSRSVPESGTASVALDTSPEGPPVEHVEAAGNGAAVSSTDKHGRFQMDFPAGNGKPAVDFSLKETDINDRLGLAVDLYNIGREPVRVFGDLNGDTWVRGYVTVPPGAVRTLYVLARRKKLAASDAEKFPGMHGIPGGKASLWAGIEEPVIAKELKLFVVTPKQSAQLKMRNLRPFGSSKIPDLTNFFPFIDKYGQYKHKDWLGKVHSDADFKTALEHEDADLAVHENPQNLDQYGGWADGPQLKATGHFGVEKHQGKWWLVDPEGKLFWSSGIDAAGFFLSSTRTRGREHFYEQPTNNYLMRNLQTKYGSDWRNITLDRLAVRFRSWGLNTLGDQADRGLMQKRKIPYTLLLTTSKNPESPSFAENVSNVLTRAAQTAKDDPWCLGFFVDNEIHDSTDPRWFESYYKQVAAIAKQIMPGTLYLGSRLDYHDWPDEPEFRKEIVRVAAKYCDVISFNFYKFTLDDFVLPEGVDKPVIIGEFHMGALDRGMFHTGLRAVIDQNQRAEGYRYYVTSALRNPAIVGAHWFQTYDESTTGRFDGENHQIGFLDICDTPYWETITAAREVGYQLYRIRAEAK